MNESVILSLISMVAFAAVYLGDVLCRDGVYDRRHPSQPLFVSCLSNMLMALPFVAIFGWPSAPTEAIVLGLTSGIVIAVTNGVYFSLVFSPAGEGTEISLFEALAPWFVVIATILWPMTKTMSDIQKLGVILAPVCILIWHLTGAKVHLTTWKYRLKLVLFSVLSAIHLVLIAQAQEWTTAYHTQVGTENPGWAGFAGTYPYYWIGMGTGVLVLLSRTERDAFRKQIPTLKKFWAALLGVEAVATLAFCAMIAAMYTEHPAPVSTIVSGFPLLIFGGGILLRRLKWLGADEEKFPLVRRPAFKVLLICLTLACLLLATMK